MERRPVHASCKELCVGFGADLFAGRVCCARRWAAGGAAVRQRFILGGGSGVGDGATVRNADLFNRTEDGEFYEWEKYAFFDMNGDGIPELHLYTGHGNSYEIYTYFDQEVTLWYSGVNYNYPLENRAMGYIRYGAAPTHIDYQYRVLDFWGNTQFYIKFTKGGMIISIGTNGSQKRNGTS